MDTHLPIRSTQAQQPILNTQARPHTGRGSTDHARAGPAGESGMRERIRHTARGSNATGRRYAVGPGNSLSRPEKGRSEDRTRVVDGAREPPFPLRGKGSEHALVRSVGGLGNPFQPLRGRISGSPTGDRELPRAACFRAAAVPLPYCYRALRSPTGKPQIRVSRP